MAGVIHLLLFVLGPWAHEHGHLDMAEGDATRIHHAHSFSSTDQVHVTPDHDEAAPPYFGADAPVSPSSHSMVAHAGLSDMALQSNRLATLTMQPRVLPLCIRARIDDVAEAPRTRTRGNPHLGRRIVPFSSGQIALHQGTDVSPPHV